MGASARAGRAGRAEPGMPAHAADGGAHEELEGHHRRHRIARAGRTPAASPWAATASVANVMGLPGRMLTSQRCCSAPSAASAALTKSWSPTETPAEEMRRSQPSPQREPRLDLVLPVARHAQIDRLRARRRHLGHQRVRVGVGDLARARWRPPRSTISSPVDRIPTVGRRITRTRLRPTRGEHAEVGGRRARGRARRAGRPDACPRRAAARSRRRAAAAARAPPSPSTSTSSCGITASAPAGSGAPVKMRKVSPGSSGRSATCPAGTWPARRRRAGRPRAGALRVRADAAHSRPSRSSARGGCRARPPPARRARGRASRSAPRARRPGR